MQCMERSSASVEYSNSLFSPTNGKDQVKTSMKLGNQYGCGVQLNCRMLEISDGSSKIGSTVELYNIRPTQCPPIR